MPTAARILAAAALLICLPATEAAAESAAARAACLPSVFQLCPAAAVAGNRGAAKSCLLKNLARASMKCQAAVRAEPPEGENPRSHAADIQR
jgi:hypothetical protein